MGYDAKEPRFELNEEPDDTEVVVDEKEAVLKAGDMTVRVDRATCAISFEAEGRRLTGTNFRNIGYMHAQMIYAIFFG